jgi:YggT family protein
VIGSALITAVNVIFQVVALAILARVLVSWLPMAGVRIDPYHPVIRFLYQITDPILEPIRRFTTFGMMDFSPIAALILIEIIRRALIMMLLRGF